MASRRGVSCIPGLTQRQQRRKAAVHLQLELAQALDRDEIHALDRVFQCRLGRAVQAHGLRALQIALDLRQFAFQRRPFDLKGAMLSMRHLGRIERGEGTKADLTALQTSNTMHCVNHVQLMNYETEPYMVNLDDHAEVGVWCSLPAALSTSATKPRSPKIHVHVRDTPAAHKRIDKDFPAISAVCSLADGWSARRNATLS